jgi:hypothetical protein
LHNRDTVATITNLSPQANNILYVQFVGSAGGDGYLNAMEISTGSPTPPPPPTGQTVLIDFGSDTSFRGVSVVNPDVNGHYWNSVQPGNYIANMIDMTNGATTIDLGPDSGMGTDSYNGPAGPTSIPPTPSEIAATDIDAAALGNLGVTNAAIDFITLDNAQCRFQLQGLDLTKKYSLTFYGSHKFNSDANTIYSVYSNSGYTTLIGVTNLDVFAPGTPWLHNRDKTVTISNLTPPADGIFYVGFVGSAGGNGYLNAMQISVDVASSTPIVITSQSYDTTSQQLTLTWTSSVGATYTIESTSNLANAFGTLVTGIASGGSSTTTMVTMTGATGFVRVKKE